MTEMQDGDKVKAIELDIKDSRSHQFKEFILKEFSKNMSINIKHLVREPTSAQIRYLNLAFA